MNINVAASIDLMTNPGVIDVQPIKHICLVGNNRPVVHPIAAKPPAGCSAITAMPKARENSRSC
jgi:hypothetical protein